MVRLIRSSFAEVEGAAGEMSQYFYAVLFSVAPGTRSLFPANMSAQRSNLLRALVHVVQLVDRPDELGPFLRQLGRDHRKFDVVTEHYDAVGFALLGALKHQLGESWTPPVERAWTQAYATIAATMCEAAATDTGPAWWNGTVVERRMAGPGIAVIRVRPDQPLPYTPGHHVSVEIPQRPRLWRYLSPANAPERDDFLEFHVRAVRNGWVSRALVNHSQVGDTWRIGPSLGCLDVRQHSGRGLLLVAGGTGLAPLRAIIDDLAQWPERPDVHLYFGGRTPDDLYDLDQITSLAVGSDWLRVTPVTERGSVAGGLRGTLGAVITEQEAWPERDVLLSGSPSMIRDCVSQLFAAGAPAERVRFDSPTLEG
ncbi:flavohemoprotein [Amycolatopsis antarctica]|uniref:nitric oxide dioxygenase n=2 Tax=Amycolatopsis antarctica TaxID=1854586 RepID=A0A263CZ66_9PSEU|nr:globin domain-containing protein [Amycolatopsis antarctica]OZM71401.1 flavohemoprotein [Amycolatopsis antarctica]